MSYQYCHPYRGDMTREISIARELLQKHGKNCANAVKELRDATDMPLSECCEMMSCTWRDIELERLETENAKLRDLCEWLLNPYRLGAVTGEGVDKRWCRETYNGGSFRLNELSGEVNEQ